MVSRIDPWTAETPDRTRRRVPVGFAGASAGDSSPNVEVSVLGFGRRPMPFGKEASNNAELTAPS